MSVKRSGAGARDEESGSWANETLPLSVRKELLERELSRMGVRKAGTQGANAAHEGAASQPRGESGASHPQADSSAAREHGD